MYNPSVRFPRRAVDHHISVVTIGGQMPENLLDDTAFAPAAQTSVNILPIPEPRWQVTPGNACAVAIHHRFHKQTVIGGRSVDMTFTTREKIFYPFPLAVTQAISSHSFSP
ncbi:hypothetical protein A4S02_07525 [Acetobacter ascendens]|uniref:Uncharacterized protein n=1 Tax=Acetobacter ascendens TaxID=481146 RepID=A0A1D8QWC5_9PROT|nr:hypothetical protein A4S02_07525 [Acetobacter ascendens]